MKKEHELKMEHHRRREHELKKEHERKLAHHRKKEEHLHKEHAMKMEHHRRKEHEMHKEHETKREYKYDPGMIEDRMVHNSRQEGIHRVCQKPGSMKAGQGGKMGGHMEKAEFNRRDQYTPAKG